MGVHETEMRPYGDNLSVEKFCLAPDSSRIVGLDSWDGPTKGVLRCEKCCTEVFFDLIDWVEGDEDDMRVFALAPLPPGSFGNIVDACRLSTSTPTWPTWLPIWRFTSEEDKASAEKRIDEVLARKGDYKVIAAWRGTWFRSFISAKDLPSGHLQDVIGSLELPRRAQKIRDWFSYLSINRDIEGLRNPSHE